MKTLLSWFYGLVSFFRNLLYDEHVLYTYTPKIPTICVGNLAVGGSGKTPQVEYLVTRLRAEGYQVAVLSRGYKRRTKGYILADEQSVADTIGDEPRQYQLKFPDVPVAVSEDRAAGIRRLCKQFPELDVIILDDAFQHRRVRCGLNILLTQADRLYVNDHLMPRGRLREAPHGANRADVVVVSKCPPTMRPIDRRVITTALHCPTFQDLCFSSVIYEPVRPVFPDWAEAARNIELAQEPDSDTLTSPSLKGLGGVFLLAGIAQPQYLIDHLGDSLVGQLLFADHHRYTQADMNRLMQAVSQLDPSVLVLTTEKDAARLRDSAYVPDALKARLYCQPIRVDFGADAEAFDRKVLRYVRENRRSAKK